MPSLSINIHSFIFALCSGVIFCFFTQRFCKKILNKVQYDYFRDLLLVGSWFILISSFGTSVLRVIVGCSVISLALGMVQHINPDRNLRWMYISVGLLFSLLGPRISFIGLPGGEYLFLSPLFSIVVTALWITMFPLLLQELDNVPGMVGHLLAITFVLVLIVTLVSGQDLGNAFMMSFSGLALLALFWSRHGHLYRQLGKPLSSFWGVIVAGTSVLGVSKGITLSTLIVIPIGLFAIPIMETSLHFASLALSEKPKGAMLLYRELVKRGLDHPTAVHLITLICATIGSIVTVFQLTSPGNALIVSSVVFSSSFVFSLPVLNAILAKEHTCRKPYLWGIPIDNVSMNYAVSRFISSAKNGTRPFIVVTVNALSAYLGRTHAKYRAITNQADLSLPDGAGILWAMKCLGTPVQERVTGIDFLEQVCRSAASEDFSVYLLGSTDPIVAKAALTLQKKYPGLTISGYRNGYFTEDDTPSVIESIKASGARILFAGMGVPLQEEWIAENIGKIGNICAVGVGGAFDVISGNIRRAPETFQKLNLEWLYRLIQEPWRLRRDLNLFFFLVQVIFTKIHLLFQKKVR